MQDETSRLQEKRIFVYAIFIPLVAGIMMVLVFILEKGMNWDFHEAGIYPRQWSRIWGIFTYVFIHADWKHLLNNLMSFELLGISLFYFYRQIALKVLFISYLSSGLLLWLIGRESWHIGASGLIYSIAFFLFFSGMMRKHVPLIALSFVVAFLYGSMVWHIFPWQIDDPVSWEGHLSGGVTGLLLSIAYKSQGPQKPVKVWEENEDEDMGGYMAGGDEPVENESEENKH
ncbi:MAG TPA: rhomboid family intramembrane serine protease [Paludibacter sp.]|nr:rhomboid family intramembrane serine protease [Paludibacter sp.]